MPYVSKLERERAQWMTLAQVVKYIQDQEGCNRDQALAQILMALSDGEIPARWAADPPPAGVFIINPPLFSKDEVPTDKWSWSTGVLFLNVDESQVILGGGPPRQLFLLRSRILEHWSITTFVGNADTADTADSTQEQTREPQKRRKGRPTAGRWSGRRSPR